MSSKLFEQILDCSLQGKSISIMADGFNNEVSLLLLDYIIKSNLQDVHAFKNLIKHAKLLSTSVYKAQADYSVSFAAASFKLAQFQANSLIDSVDVSYGYAIQCIDDIYDSLENAGFNKAVENRSLLSFSYCDCLKTVGLSSDVLARIFMSVSTDNLSDPQNALASIEQLK